MSRISDEKLAKLVKRAAYHVDHNRWAEIEAEDAQSILLELQHYRSLSADPRVSESARNAQQDADYAKVNKHLDYKFLWNRARRDRALLLSLFPETKETAE